MNIKDDAAEEDEFYNPDDGENDNESNETEQLRKCLTS